MTATTNYTAKEIARIRGLAKADEVLYGVLGVIESANRLPYAAAAARRREEEAERALKEFLSELEGLA